MSGNSSGKTREDGSMKKLLLGNEAVARGAYEAGVRVVSSYPGTPSTEITENAAKYAEVYAEWATNEKVAAEVAMGTSIAGGRSLCCMKHVGVNVAADPLFTFAYTGVNGGCVVVCADDPGMHSSQNEQDSRRYAKAAHIPMLEPSDSAEALRFTKLAYELSEKYDTPVFLRLTTRVSHSRSAAELGEREEIPLKPYKKDTEKYVMTPAGARVRRAAVERRMRALRADCENFDINYAEYDDLSVGVLCAGNVYQYVKEALPGASVLKLGLIYPLPDGLIREFASKVQRLVVAEELDPVFEEHVKALGIPCEGKDILPFQGEYGARMLREAVTGVSEPAAAALPAVVARPPVLCAGCPHRGVFFVLNKLKLTVSGDIGCYSLGGAPPLSAIDTVVCMGAGIGMAHGMEKAAGAAFAAKTVAVIGDSTFLHSGVTGLINAVYNGGSLTLIILDNSTTGMTGHQQHPATGYNIKGEPAAKIDLETLCRACGVKHVFVADSCDLKALEDEIKRQTALREVSVLIARRPCALLCKERKTPYSVGEKCVKCGACLKLGCPAIHAGEKRCGIDPLLCTACGLCEKVCRFNAIAAGGGV
jgi:indolepyruvate ferredoxin oxidoreductase alpha subunit